MPLNGYHWRHQLDALASVRRCLAPDLLGLGASDAGPGQPVDFLAQAAMLIQLIDALGIATLDLVGNDSGGAIAQILAAEIPDRIRSLTLTNCDTHGNWPPPAFLPILGLAKARQFGRTLAALLERPEIARSTGGLGMAFEFPERLTPDLLQVYLGPLTASPARMDQVDAYVAAIEIPPPPSLLGRLKTISAPTMIVWGDDDVFFGVEFGRRLGAIIPGTRTIEILHGARLFFPEERPDTLNALLRDHWRAAELRP